LTFVKDPAAVIFIILCKTVLKIRFFSYQAESWQGVTVVQVISKNSL